MKPISPHYRNDAAEGLDPAVRAYLDDNYFAKLDNLNRPNPKLAVVFSGGNAAGKSTLARRIAGELGGLVIENDAIKLAILKLMPQVESDELNRLTWQYSMDLYSRLDGLTPNGLIIRDGVIDWYYDRILPVFEVAGYGLFIIGFDISESKAKQLIKQRGDTPTVKVERFYQLLADHQIHQRRFRQYYTPDVMLTDDNLFDHDQVIQKLEQRLQSLRAENI